MRSELRLQAHSVSKFDVLFTTYEAYSLDHTWFKTRRWTYCVLDEGHKSKNADTAISRKLQGIGSLFRLSAFTASLLDDHA